MIEVTKQRQRYSSHLGLIRQTCRASRRPSGFARSLLASAASLAFLLVAGCGSGSKAPSFDVTPVIAVATTQAPPPSLLVGTSATISATVTNDPANAGVDWVATCNSAPICGSFSPSHTASGSLTTYTAPTGVPSGKKVTVMALSSTDHSKSSGSSVTILSTVSSITITQRPPANVAALTTLNLAAAVAGDPANLGVDWVATCTTTVGPVTCSPSGLHQTTGGTVPFVVPQNVMIPGVVQPQSVIGTVIVLTAFATADHSFSASASFTVTSSISVKITQAPPSPISTGASAPVIAVVSNDISNSGVTWQVSCNTGSADCGSVTPAQTPSGVAATYTAPAVLGPDVPPTGLVVSISAFSTAAGMTVLDRVLVTVVAPTTVQITQGVTNSTITQGSTAQLIATVMSDPTNSGVNWTVTCGSPGGCGSFQPTQTASGAATTYTAPSTPPVGGTVTITAASAAPGQSNVTAQQVVTVTNAPPPNSLLQGNAIIFLSSKNSKNGPYTFGGLITGDGAGTITKGVFAEADAAGNVNSSFSFHTSASAPSTYSIGLDGRGQIQLVLDTSGFTFGVPGPAGSNTSTLTMSIVFVNTKHALLTETDTFGTATGTLDLQNANDLAAFQSGAAGLNGTYAVQLTGGSLTVPYTNYFLGAGLNISAAGAAYTLQGYTVDQSASGAITSVPFATTNQFLAGSGPNANGEIQLNAINIGLTSPLNLDLWMIDANHFVIVDWEDPQNGFNYTIGGYLTTGGGALSGTYAFTESGATSTAVPQVAGGIFTCGAAGTLDVVPLGGTAMSAQPINASCASPANGRELVAFSGGPAGSPANFAAYPTIDKGIYLIELDGGAAGSSGPSGSGVAMLQTLATPIAASSLNGAYASVFSATTTPGAEAFAGQINADGASAITGTTIDVNSYSHTAPAGATPSLGASVAGTFTQANSGRFPLTLTITPAGGQPTPPITTLSPACYIVDVTSCLLLGNDTTAPGTGILQLQNTGL